MPKMKISVRAPSNIALIKYMGKKEGGGNIPENPSLSLTLDALCTVVEMEFQENQGEGGLRWVAEMPALPQREWALLPKPEVPKLGDHGMGRVIRYWERVRQRLPKIYKDYGIEYDAVRLEQGVFTLRTANTFPASSGIASSASSFAAITLASAASFVEDVSKFELAYESNANLRRSLAQLSREGSGSSCRSFDGPFVYWEETEVERLSSGKLPELAHFVILVQTDPKKVSSSEAHFQVRTSPLWDGRVTRVINRVNNMKTAIQTGDLKKVSELAWSEAWEMHSLFHTSSPPFSYWVPGTMEVLQTLMPMMAKGDAPIVTLDAGPNIHIIVEKSRREEWRELLKEKFQKLWGWVVLEDLPGKGARLVLSKGDERE